MSDRETVLLAQETAAVSAARPGQSSSRRTPGVWLVLLTLINVLWAGSAAPAKVVLTAGGGLGPCTLAFLRFAPAAVLLYLLLRLRGQRLRIERKDRLAFAVIGVFGLAVTYVIFYTGMTRASATDSTFLIAAEPVLTALMACVLLHERLRRVQGLGLLVGFVGAYVIVCQGLKPVMDATATANALVALALCFESLATVVGKRLAGRYSGLLVLTVEMLVGTAALLPLAAVEIMRRPPPALPWQSWTSLAYLAFVCSFFCYGVWFWLLPRMDVSRMAGFLFVQPIMGPVYAYMLLHEHLTAASALGALLVVLGVWLVAIVGQRHT